MSDVSTGRTRLPGVWHFLLHRRLHPNWQMALVNWGYRTSLIFLVLIFLDIFGVADDYVFWPHFHWVWIGVVYLMFQLAEICARDPLEMGQVMKDHWFSLVPAVTALVLIVLNWFMSRPLFTPEGLTIMHLWCVIAWTDFIFGVFIAQRMLSAPYRRDEAVAPRS